MKDNGCEIRTAAAMSLDIAVERTLMEIYGGINIERILPPFNCQIINEDIDERIIYYGLSTTGSSLIPKKLIKKLF